MASSMNQEEERRRKKGTLFYRQGNDWFCNTGLPSDITVSVGSANFYLHKFPLTSRCGKIDKIVQEQQKNDDSSSIITLDEIPGGSEIFLVAAKFCYGVRVEFTARNIIILYSAANFLEMTDAYGEDNLLSRADAFFHKNVLQNWKECVVALQSSESVTINEDNLQIINKCLNALAMMVCTDPSLFGWPMMMYGSLQSPGGSILWNGINTGARIRSTESDWWFEDISYLSIHLFERLLQTMDKRGIRPENLANAIMYYAKKYLPGLVRWQGMQSGKPRTVASFSMTTPASVDQKVFLESIVKLLPEKKGKSFCRFLLGLLRVALILGVNESCQDSLERRIGTQLELASLDCLLIPNYSDSDTLYNTDCVERIIHHFLSLEPSEASAFSPASLDLETSPSSGPLKKVARLVDSYLAEVASDVNLKPQKISLLAEALPDSSRTLHDGLYRAVDIYLKAHPWLPEQEKEQLCNIIDFQKLSIDACTHASQNQRLPLRVILQVLFFEQLHLRTAISGCLNGLDAEIAPAAPSHAQCDVGGQIIQRDGWITVVRENQVLKGDLENMRSRVGELEQEFSQIKEELKKVTKSHSSISSPRLRMGCNLIPRSSNAQAGVANSTGPSPRASSVEQACSHLSRHHRKSLSLV